MAARKLMNYMFVATAALLLVAAFDSRQAEARKYVGVSPFCRTASYRRSCTEMVGGATNQHDASVNAIKATLYFAEKLRGLVPTIEPAIANLLPVTRESIRKSCVDRYNDVIDYLNMSLEALDAGDMGTVKSYLSGATADYCKDTMDEFEVGKDLLLNKFSRHLNQKVDNCLAVVLQI